ncbi:MAG: hypothetical protein V1744_00465 [Candidatus Altiarchaeota archaeon]
MDSLQFLLTPSTPIQTPALVFLLGSLTVSSLSDLKRMAAQADFAEVWAAFTGFMFLSDVYFGVAGQLPLIPFVVKWVMILLFAAATTQTHLFAISTMDVAALTALLAILSPVYILLAMILTLIVNELLQPILRKYGEAGAYPFLPTVLAVNLLVLLLIEAGGIEML